MYRFGLADGLQTDEYLLALLENPASLGLQAAYVEGRSGSTVATTGTHALYPVALRELVEVLRDDSVLPRIMPDLTLIETICRNGPELMKQMQRVEFNLLFLQFGTEYLIDVHIPLDNPDEYGSYWGM